MNSHRIERSCEGYFDAGEGSLGTECTIDDYETLVPQIELGSAVQVPRITPSSEPGSRLGTPTLKLKQMLTGDSARTMKGGRSRLKRGKRRRVSAERINMLVFCRR